MPTPRQPQPAPDATSRRILLVCIAALLLIGGWIWLDYTTTPKPVATLPVAADTISNVATTNTVQAQPRPSAPPTANVAVPTTKPSMVKTPVVTQPEPIADARPEPVPETPVLRPNPVVEKPKPAKCDQLVMRNGDLLDVAISEVGVQTIKYKRCNWPDSPQYTVLKADALSIHFANGDTERF